MKCQIMNVQLIEFQQILLNDKFQSKKMSNIE